jgi:hypothetical protein
LRLSRSINAEAALACGFLLMALGLSAPTSVAEAKNHAPVSLTLHPRSVDPRATAKVPAATAPFWPDFFGFDDPTPRKPETDGLTRNPADCVKYGCIDEGDGQWLVLKPTLPLSAP